MDQVVIHEKKEKQQDKMKLSNDGKDAILYSSGQGKAILIHVDILTKT